MYDTLAAGEIKENIDIKVYTGTIEGTEIVNLRVASMGDPSLRDSINVYVTVAAGIEEREDKGIQNSILQVYPNPFREITNLKLQIQNAKSRISLKIYGATGILVRQWDYLTIGLSDQITWDGTDDQDFCVPEGVYFAKLESQGQSTVQKVILLR